MSCSNSPTIIALERASKERLSGRRIMHVHTWCDERDKNEVAERNKQPANDYNMRANDQSRSAEVVQSGSSVRECTTIMLPSFAVTSTAV